MKEAEVRAIIQIKILKWMLKLKNSKLSAAEELLVLPLGIWLLKDMEEM